MKKAENKIPPIHPAIVHFPIALLTLSVLADLFGYIYQSDGLRGAGWWSLFGAAIGGSAAVVAGLYDMNREEIGHEAHERVHTHMKVGFVVLAVVAALTIWRWIIYANPGGTVSVIYLVIAFLALGLTFFQGWLGGELVFSDGVGVALTGQGTQPPEKAKDSAAKDEGGNKTFGGKLTMESEHKHDAKADEKHSAEMGKMKMGEKMNMYWHLAIETAISAVIMYLVMFVMIDNLGSFYNNINMFYMTLMMVAPMVVIMLVGAMRSMFPNKKLNYILVGGFAAIFILCFTLIRTQFPVGNAQFLRSMIPHHSGAILMCQESDLTDPDIIKLCDGIIKGQKQEIDQMKAILERAR